MPEAHQRYANTTPANLIGRAARIGPNATILIERMMRDRPHPEQGYRSATGILSLVPRYGPERVDAACEQALSINAIAYPRSTPSSNPASTGQAPHPNRQGQRRRTPISPAMPITSEGRRQC